MTKDITDCDCVELRCAMLPDGVNKCNKFMGYLGIKGSGDIHGWNTDINESVEFLRGKRVFPICRDCSRYAVDARIAEDRR